jgi:phage replication-related protein YjqB (UPF0714/DUF867 family)
MTNAAKAIVKADIFLGGLNQSLIKITNKVLNKTNFNSTTCTEFPKSDLSGKQTSNVTNKCSSSLGMQVEISEDLRATFFKGNFKQVKGRKEITKEFERFCAALAEAISIYNK